MILRRIIPLSIATSLLLLASCGKNSSDSSSSSNKLSGIAATGAPVVNGSVEIKGKSGKVIETTTSSSGLYSSDVSTLVEPFLVRVTTPTGLKIISVATSADVKSGKKINITPLTHTIVANVFQNKNADTLFDNFTTESSKYSDAKRDFQKKELVDTLIESGVISGNGIISDRSVDLMSGSFSAGSGEGIDRLLDSLDIELEAGDKINIKIKGSGKTIVEDDPAVVNETNIIDVSGEVNAAKKQLTVLGELKKLLIEDDKIKSEVVKCSGVAVDDNSSCDKDKLHAKVKTLLHTDYNWDGANKDTDAWAWFCNKSKGGDEANSKADCKYIDSDVHTFKNITIIKHDLGVDGVKDTVDDIYTVSMNAYRNGVFAEGEVDRFKKEQDSGVWKFFGNNHKYSIWPNSRSVHRSHYNIKTKKFDLEEYRSEVFLGLNRDSAIAASNNHFKDAVLSVSGNDALNDALKEANNGSLDLKLNSSKQLILSSKECIKIGTEVVTSSGAGEGGINCANAGYGINYDANILKINKKARSLMKLNNDFKLVYTDDSGAYTETYNIVRPVNITSKSAGKYMPVIDETNLCSVARNKFKFKAPKKTSLNFFSVHYYDDNNNRYSGNGQIEANSIDLKDQMSEISGSEKIVSASFYTVAKNKNDNQFVRLIDCW